MSGALPRASNQPSAFSRRATISNVEEACEFEGMEKAIIFDFPSLLTRVFSALCRAVFFAESSTDISISPSGITAPPSNPTSPRISCDCAAALLKDVAIAAAAIKTARRVVKPFIANFPLLVRCPCQHTGLLPGGAPEGAPPDVDLDDNEVICRKVQVCADPGKLNGLNVSGTIRVVGQHPVIGVVDDAVAGVESHT